MLEKRRSTRREFLSQTGKTAAAGVAAFQIIPPHYVFSAPNRPAPSDSLVLGHIGVGGRGRRFVRDWSKYICDVDEQRLDQAAERAAAGDAERKKQIKLYTDYRELLDQEEIDAVFIASPDHWHALH